MNKKGINSNFRTWLEIDKKSIEKNIISLKKNLNKNTLFMAVVKSNAYGHGMIDVAKLAVANGADFLAVDEINEALDLRKSGIRSPILVLGYTLPEFYNIASKNKITLTISSIDSLLKISKQNFSKKLNIHIKFDTGLHRQGIFFSDLNRVIKIISSENFPATVQGIYTHFATMENTKDESYSRMQFESFQKIVFSLKEKGFTPLAHASASSGILFSNDFNLDISRAGISIYGLWPSQEIKEHVSDRVKLYPALSWKTKITEIKMIPRGSKVGYDLTYETDRETRLAIIPVGYWHGLPRSVSNSGYVLVRGKKAKIIGRVSMDMSIIDITDIPNVKISDEVVIIGKQGNEFLSAEELARLSNTINYEIVTRINPLLPRIFI